MDKSISYVLNNFERIENSPNELFIRETLNRNFKKLHDNDLNLIELYSKLVEDIFGIHGYVDGGIYDKGEFVWFLGTNKQNNEKTLYLLRSMKDNNDYYPTLELDEDNIYSFKKSFWEDKNELATLFENSLKNFATIQINQLLDSKHLQEKEYHKFESLNGDKSYNDTKLLLRDFSNIDKDRETNFYPYNLIPLSASNVIQSGICRQWHNGLIEYDIIFKLGYVGQERFENSLYDSISCNTLQLNQSESTDTSDLDFNQNSCYFNNDSYQIFNKQFSGDELSVRLGGMIQHNRAENFNSYSGKIIFPIPFKDLNYMVFTSDIRCQDRDLNSESIDPGDSSIIFTDKCRQSIVAIYIIRSLLNDSSKKTGLIANSFHCQLIGRWK